jgi:hypothetical protein
MADLEFDRRWREAEAIASVARRQVAPAARRLHRRMKLQQHTGYQFLEERGTTPHSDDAQLASKVVTNPDAD